MVRKNYGSRPGSEYIPKKSMFGSTVSTKQAVKEVANEVAVVKKKVSKLKADKEDIHYIDGFTQLTNAGVDWTGQMKQLAPIAQGDTEVNRTGLYASVKWIDINMNLYCFGFSPAVTGVAQKVRIVVFLDKMNNTVVPTPTDLFANPAGSYLSNMTATEAPYNYVTYPNRFKILFDKVYTLGNIAGHISTLAIKRRVKVNKKIEFTGTTGSTYYKNTPWMCIISDQSAATQPGYTAIVRTFFDE